MKFLTIRRLTLIALLAFCLFSASTGIAPIKAQEATLRVMVWSWSPEVDEALEGALADFRESRGVNVELIRVPPETYWDELSARLGSEEPPDLLWVHSDMVPPLVEQGQIIDLDPFLPGRPEVIQGIPDEVLERFRFEGRLYGIPLGPEGEFALNAYAVSTMAAEFGRVDLALELIILLRSRIPPSPISPPPPGELPDLAVAELMISPERPQPGDEVTIEVVIENIGNAPAEEILVLFLVDRQLLEGKTIGYLEPGGREVVTATWIATVPGEHTLYIEIDPEARIGEGDEGNNSLEEVITVSHGIEELPDLAVSEEGIIISPPVPYVGDEVTVEATIRNEGNAPAGGVSVVFRGADGWEQWASIEYIEAGGEEAVRIAERASSPGEYLITVMVDPENRIDEWDEENNEASRSISVREEELPDLMVAGIGFVPEAPHAGQAVVIKAIVRNQGDWDAGDFFVSLSVDDQRIGSQIIGRLAPSGEEEIWVNVAPLAAGGHSVKVIVDPDDWVRESDETNNEVSRSLTVREAELPDLIIEALTINPENPAPGEAVAIQATIRNRGRGPAEWVDVALSIIDMEKAQQTECPPDAPYADEVAGFAPGAGADPDFGDPAAALGPPDLSGEPPQGFVSLGIGGSITLAFVDNLVIDEPGNDLRIWGKPDQDAFYVEVSEDGYWFESFGLVRGVADLDLADIGLESAQFVRIRDDGSREEESRGSPGVELDAVEALHCRPQVDWLELDYLKVFAYLEPGQREIVTVIWTATSVGDHILVAEIDALDSVRESDETNNKIERVIRVKEG